LARRWRWQESNPLRQRLQGAPATLAVIPRCPQDGTPAGLTWCSRC